MSHHKLTKDSKSNIKREHYKHTPLSRIFILLGNLRQHPPVLEFSVLPSGPRTSPPPSEARVQEMLLGFPDTIPVSPFLLYCLFLPVIH